MAAFAVLLVEGATADWSAVYLREDLDATAGVAGLGISCVFPATLSAAGDGVPHPGPEIAAVATCGYVGFLVGPPSVGGLAEVTGLGDALWLLVGLTAVAAVALTISARR